MTHPVNHFITIYVSEMCQYNGCHLMILIIVIEQTFANNGLHSRTLKGIIIIFVYKQNTEA